MKKKPVPEPVVSPEILQLAKRSIHEEKQPAQKNCIVCGAACLPLTGPQQPDDDDLCWVCRRLKISAWRDADHQLSAPE